MNLDIINEILKDQPRYRYDQINEAIYKNLISDWTEAKNLPKDITKQLNEFCPLNIKSKLFSDKNFIKALLVYEDKNKIESVLMKHKDGRNTVCVSSMAGCPLGCLFCATGKIRFKRNLKYFEIIEQVLLFARILKKENKKITNIVFMGMGEPMLNYDEAMKAIRILNDKEGFNLGARNFSISTVGITEGIKKLAKEKLQINLAISLHSSNGKLRQELIPVGKKYTIEKIKNAVDYYIEKTNRRVMFEYMLIKNKNDSDKDARDLARLVNKSLYFVNLILYNQTGDFESSNPDRVKKFKNILERNKISVTLRHRFGENIGAACGQLAGK